MRILILLSLIIAFPISGYAELPVGKPAPLVVLDGDLGGRVIGGKWSSDELKGVVHVLFYVDPDESDLNNHVSEAIKAENYDKNKFRSVAIVNMDATWLPNAVIQMKLESKQEEYPNTVYVRDLEKTIVKKWGLADDNSDVVLFGKDGTVLYSVDGKYTDAQVIELLQTIRENL